MLHFGASLWAVGRNLSLSRSLRTIVKTEVDGETFFSNPDGEHLSVPLWLAGHCSQRQQERPAHRWTNNIMM